jgi:hypothetical protein
MQIIVKKDPYILKSIKLLKDELNAPIDVKYKTDDLIEVTTNLTLWKIIEVLAETAQTINKRAISKFPFFELFSGQDFQNERFQEFVSYYMDYYINVVIFRLLRAIKKRPVPLITASIHSWIRRLSRILVEDGGPSIQQRMEEIYDTYPTIKYSIFQEHECKEDEIAVTEDLLAFSLERERYFPNRDNQIRFRSYDTKVRIISDLLLQTCQKLKIDTIAIFAAETVLYLLAEKLQIVDDKIKIVEEKELKPPELDVQSPEFIIYYILLGVDNEFLLQHPAAYYLGGLYELKLASILLDAVLGTTLFPRVYLLSQVFLKKYN